MKKKHLLIIGIVLICTLFSMGIARASVNNEFENKITDIFINNNYDAIEKYNEILENNEYGDYRKNKAYIYMSMANTYDKKSDFNSSIIYFDKSIEIYKELNDIDYLLKVYNNVIRMTLSCKDYRVSEKYINELLDLGRKILNNEVGINKNEYMRDANRLVSFYTTMETICNEFGMEYKADWYLGKTIELIKNYDLDIAEKFNYNNRNYKKAIEIYSLDFEEDFRDNNDKSYYYKEREYIIIPKSKVLLGRIDDAEVDIDKLLELYKKNQDKLGTAKALIIKGDIYVQRNEYLKAAEIYETSYELAEILKSNQLIKDISDKLIDIYKLQDNMDARNKYVEKYLEMDKILSESNGYNKIFNMIDKFQTEQSEIRIENGKHIAKYRLIVFSIIVILLLIILILKFRQNNNTAAGAKELREALITDGLTGTYTREYVISKIESNIIEKKRFSIAMIDVDDYKKINDTYGHSFGDRVLIEIVRGIEEVIGEGNMLGRYGGEEFIVLLNEEDIEKAFDIYENIREVVQRIKVDNDCKVTISMGVKEYRSGPLEKLLVDSDNLLYRAKKNGKNRIEF